MDELLEEDPDCPGCRKRNEVIAELREIVEAQQRRIEALEARIASLEAQLGKDSTNSSKPPSSDGPGERAGRDSGESSQRHQGAQPGHEGHHREDVDASEVDEVEDVKPDECRRCGHELAGEDDDPETHQVTDIRIEKIITEYRRHTLECECCGGWTRAEMPEEVPSSQFGPVISAVACYLTGKAHLSRRNTEEMLGDVFDVQMSLGTVSNKEAKATQALARPYREARGWVAESLQVHLDETSWKQAETNGWLWVITDGEVAAYLIDESRSAEVARELLGGEPLGEVVTDRHSAYNWIPTESRQICLPHLHRNFKGWALEEGLGGELGGLLASYMRELFVWIGRIRDGTIEQEQFRQEVGELRGQISTALEVGAKAAEPSDRFEQLLDLEDAMWTFLDVDGLPANNNAAERALRTAVLWRKQSFGTESKRGSRFVERVLTATQTLKRQGRQVMEFLDDLWQSVMFDEPAPSLLPA